LRKTEYCWPCQFWLPSIRLFGWNFTGGAFAVFGCFATLKCCGLNGFPAATPAFPGLPPGPGLGAPAGLPAAAASPVVAALPLPFALPTSAGLA
jgi:hypothetical protein